MIVGDAEMTTRELVGEVRRFPVHYAFVLAARFVASPYSKIAKSGPELEIGDEIVGWGVLTKKQPAMFERYWLDPAEIVPGFDVTFEKAGDPLTLETTIEASEEFRVGPETNWEKAYDAWQRYSGVIGQRRRRGHVTYYVGPWNIYCYRTPLKAQIEWIGLDRFRKD